MEKGPQAQVAAVPYEATFNPSLLRNLQQVKEALDSGKEQVDQKFLYNHRSNPIEYTRTVQEIVRVLATALLQ